MYKSFEFFFSIAKSYYVEGLSKSEIALRYNISRPTVAAILKECREKGIVEIRLNDQSSFSPVSRRLIETYKLQSASIIPNEKNENLTLTKTCYHAALYFTSLLRDRLRIGVSWGNALYHMIQQLPQSPINDGEVIQLMGGLGGSALLPDGSELARLLASKLHSRCFTLLAPLFVKSETLKKSLLSEKSIRETYERTKYLDVALVGISPADPRESGLVRAGFVSSEEALAVYHAGSCCDICGYRFDKNGNCMDISTNRRIMGIDFKEFMNIPRRIAIACGKAKAAAIRVALSGNLVTDIFTDEETALLI